MLTNISFTAKRLFSTMNSIPTVPRHHLLVYKYVADIAEKRPPFRAAHLAHTQKYADKGKLLLGGALVEPLDSAVLVFEGCEEKEVAEFVANDPYVQNDLVKEHTIRPWMIVTGSLFKK
eukprot:TRINITY_DN2346_c0_g1_i1.p1 TRINITY_DN2346_c0_g1~~TRINITY_DN2346_c0_g1_i1.p1  ORF type:complete len:119 (-),score=11.59 TRINITY_DN2346_c0_g1_i1:127-483(-)